MDVGDLIREINIVEFLRQYVELEERGGEWWGLSPFKEEMTPSFSVREETHSFYDFSSGIGGNVFTFVRKFHNISNEEAVAVLARYLGVEGEAGALRERLSATAVARKYKRAEEKPKKEVIIKEYPETYMADRYKKDWEKLSVWEEEGISRDSMDRFEVFYDGFSERIVYPIRNDMGTIVNIGGRTLDPLWKEKKLRKYTYFSSWGALNVIYGLYENLEHIMRQKEIILFEGCKSVLMADTYGIKNTGAILTSHLNPNQMRLLARLGVHVVFALDEDVDITKDHNIGKLRRFANVSYLWDKDGLLQPKDSPIDQGYDVFINLYERRYRYR